VGAASSGFDLTPEHTWLLNNAQKYGFVMSYPKGNAYYIYEPWHWRYVGVDLANRLKTDNKHFYDLDQRVIDDYLLLIFN
jgi:D-alanyl-D-alanine carboxypeptidase